jgi:hypothetical protein
MLQKLAVMLQKLADIVSRNGFSRKDTETALKMA